MKSPIPAVAALLVLVASSLPGAARAAPGGARERSVPTPQVTWDALRQLEDRFAWVSAESLARAIAVRPAAAPALDSMDYSRALVAIGTARLRRGLFADGEGYRALEQGIAIRDRHFRPGDAVLAEAHVTAAILYTDGGRVEDARAHGEEALRLLAASSPPDTVLLAQAQTALGVAQSRLGHDTEARAAFERALALREAKYGPESSRLVPTLAQFGEFQARLGEFDGARALLMRAIANSANGDPPTSDHLEGSIARLSTLERRVGNIAESIELAQRALELTRARVGDDARETAMRRIVVAYRLADLQDHAAAASTLETALGVMDARMGPANPTTINARLGLVGELIACGDTARAGRELAAVREALLHQEALPNQNQASLRWNAAALEIARGRLGAARETLATAIRMERRRDDPTGSTLAELLSEALAAARDPRDRGYAGSLGAEVDRLRDSTRVRATPEWIDLLSAQAQADARVGERDPAWERALVAERLARSRLGYALQALPDRRALQLSQRLGSPCDLLVRLARPDHADEVATAWDRIVRWRGLVSHEIERRRLPPHAESDTAIAGAHQRWIAAQRRLAQLVVGGAAHPDDPATAGRFEAARQAAEESERHYVRLTRGAVAADDTLGLSRVLDQLGPRQALVAFTIAGAGAGDDSLGAFVATGRDRRARLVPLGRVSALDSLVQAWTGRLATPPASVAGARALERAGRLLGARVRAAVWDPVVPWLADADEVFLVPERPLFELPWLALPASGDRYLADAPFVLRVLNAERELLPRTERPITSGLLALGAPDYDAGAAPAPGGLPLAMVLRARSWPCSGEPVALPPLPATRAEVEDIARDWPAPAGPAVLLLGAAADEASFKLMAPGHTVIHVATHGVIVEDTCGTRTAGGLRGMGGVEPVANAPRARRKAADPAVAQAAPRPRAPWLERQVWLALAGANRPPAEARDENEGLLTAEEVTTLDLRGTDWVVLSACQSGVAPAWAREGVLGMRRAFQLAGARTVIASQWPVADAATRELMDALYAARAHGGSSGAALRAACRTVLGAMRRAGRPTDPFYWAAFSATGE